MVRPLRIAVEPPLSALDGAAGGCLIDKGLRHKGDLIKERPGEGNALDQVLRGFVLPAEEVEGIDPPAAGDNQQVVGASVLTDVTGGGNHLYQHGNDIASEGADGLAAEGKARAVEGRHRPEDKGKRHTDRLAGADRAVGDNAVIIGEGRSVPPPRHNFQLFG